MLGRLTVSDCLQFDEVDETDGCKVHVTEYHILSADGQEEMTKTCRRKLKIECNQSTRKTEIANGKCKWTTAYLTSVPYIS